MKLTIAFILAFGTQSIFACMPPQFPGQLQVSQYQAVTDSEAFSKLFEAGGRDVDNIRFDKKLHKYVVSATNGCSVVASIIYSKPTQVGECPIIASVEVEEANCPKN